MISLFGCGGKKHTIDFHGQRDFFDGAKDSYRAGETVRFYFSMIATDTDYAFYVDGARFSPQYSHKKGYEFCFTMPDRDIDVRVESHNSMLYIPET